MRHPQLWPACVCVCPALQTRVFMEGHYLHNFVQSTFDSLPAAELKGSTLVVSGDGR